MEFVPTHRQREPQPGPRRVHSAAGITEPERYSGDRRSNVHLSTLRATRRTPMACRSAETS